MKIDQDRREIICGNLKELLKFLDLTQAELAKSMGISHITISSWINGRCVPSSANWKALRFVCETLSLESYGEHNVATLSFDIPNVTMKDLIRWQTHLKLLPDGVLQNIGS